MSKLKRQRDLKVLVVSHRVLRENGQIKATDTVHSIFQVNLPFEDVTPFWNDVQENHSQLLQFLMDLFIKKIQVTSVDVDAFTSKPVYHSYTMPLSLIDSDAWTFNK